MLRQDSWMFSGSAHCARMDANERPVLPSAGPAKASTTTTSSPARARWKALLAPRAPAPTTMTSAVTASLPTRGDEPLGFGAGPKEGGPAFECSRNSLVSGGAERGQTQRHVQVVAAGSGLEV